MWFFRHFFDSCESFICNFFIFGGYTLERVFHSRKLSPSKVSTDTIRTYILHTTFYFLIQLLVCLLRALKSCVFVIL